MIDGWFGNGHAADKEGEESSATLEAQQDAMTATDGSMSELKSTNLHDTTNSINNPSIAAAAAAAAANGDNQISDDDDEAGIEQSLSGLEQQQQQQQKANDDTTVKETGIVLDNQSHPSKISQCEKDFFQIQSNNNNYNNFDDVEEAHDDDSAHQSAIEFERAIFLKARQMLCPGPLYRFFVYLYAERKLLVFFMMHFVATMVIWSHFALIKFQEQKDMVPDGAPRYWWKRLAPPLEFGSMHAILFQMSLIPLTMSRLTIASLTENAFVERIFPLNRVLRMHIHLGYTMILIVVLATLFFFAFFGLLCSDGDQQFCDNFKSEIMITGYVIFLSLILVGVTSYCRHIIPYEVFYVIHHLVFIMYIITIAHTLDNKQRSGSKERSQTFKWFTSTLLYYMCDRIAMHLNHKYTSKVLTNSTTAVEGSDGSKIIILRVNRPSLFHFKPGQYAYLKMGQIDPTWHPFSIASSPSRDELEFYIEVCDEEKLGRSSWTSQLWDILRKREDNMQQVFEQESLASDEPRNDDKFGEYADLLPDLNIQILGPYGTSLVRTEDFSHVLAVGAGTGVVPVISLFKKHVHQLLKLDPTKFLQELQERETKILNIDLAQEKRKGSLFSKCVSCFQRNNTTKISSLGVYDRIHQRGVMFGDGARMSPTKNRTRRDLMKASIRSSLRLHENLRDTKIIRDNKRDMEKAAYNVTRSIYGIVMLSLLPILGITVLGFAISWNTIKIGLYDGMAETLQCLAVTFQAVFFAVSFFLWDGNSLFAYVDTVFCVITPFADWYWRLAFLRHGVLRPVELTLFCILIGYMTIRVWVRVVEPKHLQWRNELSKCTGLTTLDRLEVVWTTRSASLVAKLLPDIANVWDSLLNAWGSEEFARKVCRISIHVTDPDEEACVALQRKVEQTSLNRYIHFERADFSLVIEQHTLDMICSRRNSSSMLAFCGSPEFAREIHEMKISNDMIAVITGNKHHQMDFVSESYGGVKSSDASKLQEAPSGDGINDFHPTGEPKITNKHHGLMKANTKKLSLHDQSPPSPPGAYF